MRFYILVLFLALFLSCSKKTDDSTSVVVTETQLALEDSLNTVVDSLSDVKRMHAVYQGQHVHNPNDNLAAVAHQDPERDRQIRRSIRNNRDRQLEVYEDQNKKMFDMIREQNAKDTSK